MGTDGGSSIASVDGGGSDGSETTSAGDDSDPTTDGTDGTSGDPAGTSTGATGTALLVTQLGDLSLPLDLTLHASLQGKGLEVVVVEDAVVTPDDAVGVDLVVISETVSISAIGGTLRDVARPIVCLEGGIWASMAMSAPGAWVPGTQVEIVDSTHPIAAGLGGLVPVLVEDPGSGLVWASAPPSAHAIARLPGSGGALVAFAYEAGVPMQGGFVAPARRVAFGADVDADGALPSPSDLSPAGVAIFEAAVQWALP